MQSISSTDSCYISRNILSVDLIGSVQRPHIGKVLVDECMLTFDNVLVEFKYGYMTKLPHTFSASRKEEVEHQ